MASHRVTGFFRGNGFNVPGHCFKPFIQGLFDPLTEEEQDFVELIRCRTDKYAVIGVHKEKGLDFALDHEIAHAMYYVNEEYHKEVNEVLKFDGIDNCKAMIKAIGYADEVLLDEVHAYFGVDGQWLKQNKKELMFEHKVEFPEEAHKKLLDLYNKYKKKEAA